MATSALSAGPTSARRSMRSLPLWMRKLRSPPDSIPRRSTSSARSHRPFQIPWERFSLIPVAERLTRQSENSCESQAQKSGLGFVLCARAVHLDCVWGNEAQLLTLHGETLVHFFSSSRAHWFDLS